MAIKTVADLKKELHKNGIKTYKNKRTNATYVKKADVGKIVQGASLADSAVNGFTMQYLADVVNANEKVRDEDAVWKVFDEILKEQVDNAKEDIKNNMDAILESANAE